MDFSNKLCRKCVLTTDRFSNKVWSKNDIDNWKQGRPPCTPIYGDTKGLPDEWCPFKEEQIEFMGLEKYDNN